jgi:prephenate dehydrogenase
MPDRLLPVVDPDAAGTPPVFDRVAIVGLGLVGGSLALAARRRWPAALVIGIDRNDVLEKAIVRHAIDVASDDLMIASEADLVVLAAPVRQNLALMALLADHVAGRAVVTDVGSTKRGIVERAGSLPERLTFVGGHPLAGAARSGIDFATPDLFKGRPWLLTPGAETPAEAVSRLSEWIQGLGARPVVVPSAGEHDRLVAYLSHVPQLAASALMAVVGEHVGPDGLALAGRGLADTTRLASSPADIWRDICATNADEIGPALDRLIDQLQAVRRDLADSAAIDRLFESAGRWRERLPTVRS